MIAGYACHRDLHRGRWCLCVWTTALASALVVRQKTLSATLLLQLQLQFGLCVAITGAAAATITRPNHVLRPFSILIMPPGAVLSGH